MGTNTKVQHLKPFSLTSVSYKMFKRLPQNSMKNKSSVYLLAD